MSTNSSNSNSHSGSGNITATIGNDFPHPDYAGIPRFFVHGNNKIVLRTVDFIDKAGTQTAINLVFPNDIENRRYEFVKDAPYQIEPLEFSYRSFNEDLKEWVDTTYLKENVGYIDVQDFNLEQGYLKAAFSFQFTTYKNPKIHTVSGIIDVAGLIKEP
jgi:hypothetical protein